MSIYVVRHGQTDWNISGFFQGHQDIPLNSTGIKQAVKTAKQFQDIQIDCILVSPLKRAIQTAEAISKVTNVEITIEPRLIERAFGNMEGKRSNSNCNIQMMLDYDKNYNIENIEPIQSLFARIYSFLDDITQKYNSKNIVLVTHGGVSMPIDCYFNGIPKVGNFDTLIPRVLNNCEIKKYEIK